MEKNNQDNQDNQDNKEDTTRKTFLINKDTFDNAGDASLSIKSFLKSLKLDNNIIKRVSVCAYEAEMNAVMHGGNNSFIDIEIWEDKLIVDVCDDGLGIENINLAMQKGYSTAKDEFRELGFGAGMGLPNIKANSDELNICSERNKGTKVQIIFLLKK